MECFSQFTSEYNFFTPVELKEIKQMLLSGDRDQILKSVEKIKVYLNNEESLRDLIRSDIPEFLCDAVILFDEPVVGGLYCCLESMTKHVEFFSDNHSCFIIESLLRSLYFLMKNSGAATSLQFNQCLNLIVAVVQGFTSYSIAPEKKTTENLLRLLPTILRNSLHSVHCKYQIGQLILGLTQLSILNWNQENCKIVLTSFCSWFSLLTDVLESLHPMREKFILLCCQLSHSMLRSLVLLQDITFEFQTQLKCDSIVNICEFLINVAAPYFDRVSLNTIESDPSGLENFYQAVLYFFSDDITPGKNRITHGLSEMGFIQFTTRIISFVDFSHGQKLRGLCVIVLFHVIFSLSGDAFQISEVWPTGRENFHTEIIQGISQLPLDASQWLDTLTSPHSTSSCKLILLLYLYFYAMTAKSQMMLEVIFPYIVNFIHTTSGVESSILLVKVVWFIFVMSQLSSNQSSIIENEARATDKMVSLLEAQEDLSLVYTHHPALLYWAFSSKVNSNIQSRTVHLWLRNKTPDCKELEELIGRSSDVRFAILDILQKECGQVLDSAFSSLKTILMESEDDEFASNIWFLLPQVLAKFTADSTSATNVDYVIELSSLKTPESVDIAKVIRIASLLPEVLLKSDLISIVPSLNLTFRLLELGFKMKDSRVMSAFLRFDDYLKKILGGLDSDVSDICVSSLKIISLLWKESIGFQDFGKYRKVSLAKETILRILGSKCIQVLPAALHFLQEVSLTSFQSPIFEIQLDSNFIEVLFLEILHTSVKGIPDTLIYCWNCLRLFLAMTNQSELVTNPLLHEVIRFHLPRLKESQDMKEFLKIWLDIYNGKLNDSLFERKIFGGFYSESLQCIATRLRQNFREEDRTLYEKVSKSGLIIEHVENVEE